MVDRSTIAAGSGGSNSNSSWVCSKQDAVEAQIVRFEHARAADALGRPSCYTIFRVPKRVLDRIGDEDKSYTPDSISLGLFHTPGRYDAAPTAGENFKVKMASAFIATLREIRRKESSSQLASNSFLQLQVDELESSRRPDEDDPAKPTPTPHSRSNAYSNSNSIPNSIPISNSNSNSNSSTNSNSKTMEDKSGSKLVGDGEGASVQVRTVKSGTEGVRDYVWTDLCYEVVSVGGLDLKSIKQLYQLLDDDLLAFGESDEQIQCALALDAVALATGMGVFYLDRDFELFQFPRFRDYLDCGRDEARSSSAVLKFYFDFLKLENQIPLCLLRSVMRILHNECPVGRGEQGSKGDRALNWVCAKLAIDYSQRFLPGYDHIHTEPFILDLKDRGLFLDCDHLLDCISLVMRMGIEGNIEGQKEQGSGGKSSAVKRPSWVALWVGRWRGRWWFNSCGRRATRRTTSVQNRNFNIPSATRLHEAGIDFRNRAGFHNCDLLPVFEPGWFKATLYIPTLPRLSILTLTVWKNLVAYECPAVHVEKRLESQFFGILDFMGCLIDTKEDVLLMTRGQSSVLPDRHSSAPEDLASVFKTILIGYPVPDYQRWRDLKQQIISYHNQKWRRMVLDFFRTNFGKPWLIISVMAAFVLLVLTFLQTIYTILAYYEMR